MVIYFVKPTDTVKLRDGTTASNLAEVDTGGRVSTNLYATPDSGVTILPVKCDAEGNLSTTGSLVIVGAVSNFRFAETIAASATTTFLMLTVPAGKKYIITDYGVTSIDYAGVSMTLVQDTGGGDTDVLRDKQTATEFMARRTFNGGLIFPAGSTISIKITNDLASISTFDLYMTGKEVDA